MTARLSTTPSRPPIPPRLRVRRTSVQGISVVLGTVLLATGCSLPGLPGATGAPATMERAAEVQAPAATTEPVDAEPETNDAGAATEAPDTSGAGAATEVAGTEASEPTEAAAAGRARAVWVPVKADLDSGATTHTLSAAAHTIVIDYWMDGDVSQLTPDSTPILRMNARIDGADDGTQIAVTRFNAQVQSLGVELANDTGSFAINPPYSYLTAVALPSNPDARATDVLVTFDLLTETAPGSGIVTRQTILDTVSLGYARPPSESK